jgi:hypothetical protein
MEVIMCRRECFRLSGLLVLFLACQGFAQSVGTPFGLSAENPSISAVGEILGRYDFGQSEFLGGLGNAELGFQAPIDPFGRADLLLHYSAGLLESHDHDHEAESEETDSHEHGSGFVVEEALITLTSLPAKLQLAAGRMRSRIGILNVVHLHDFNFIEYPGVITDYWGHEGLSVDGIRASWLAPLPFWAELVVEGQKLPGEGANFGTFGANTFFPFSEDIGLVVTGFGYVDKPQEHESEEGEHHEEEYGLNGFGAGFRLKWKPSARAVYTHLLLQGEFMSRTIHEEDHAGFYAMGEYLFARQWTFGALFQSLEVPSTHEDGHAHDDEADEKATETWLGATLSYWPSEFQRVRMQYDHPVDMDDADARLTFQWTFIIGPHKPHAY